MLGAGIGHQSGFPGEIAPISTPSTVNTFRTFDNGCWGIAQGRDEAEAHWAAAAGSRCSGGRPGNVVTRDELQKKLWPDTVVDVDHNLNTAINEIRETLEDSAESPRFVKTIPRRGYAPSSGRGFKQGRPGRPRR